MPGGHALEAISNGLYVPQSTEDAKVAVDFDTLAAFGTWDPMRKTFLPDLVHPAWKSQVCGVDDCERLWEKAPYCEPHLQRWFKAGRPSNPEEWLIEARPSIRDLCLACRIPGHERPVEGNTCFCSSHAAVWYTHKKRIPRYADPHVFAAERCRPLPTLGDCIFCGALGATRWGQERVILCVQHYHKAYVLNARHGFDKADAVDEIWRRTQEDPNTIDLSPWQPRIQAQILIVLTETLTNGYSSPYREIKECLRLVRDTTVEDLTQSPESGVGRDRRKRVTRMKRLLRRHHSTPETERPKVLWDLATWPSRSGYLDFRGITQAWLLTATQDYVYDRVESSATSTMKAWVSALSHLSRALGARPDHGDDISRLCRDDILDFKRYMQSRRNNRVFSGQAHTNYLRFVYRLLNELQDRDQGEHLRSQGLQRDFRLHERDIPPRPRTPRTEVGKALPPEVMSFLLAEEHLSLLPPMCRRMLLVEAASGRRPRELRELPWDCLTEEAGEPVLLVDMPKVHKVGYPVPLRGEDRAIAAIREQQEVARRQFPDTPVEDLVLWPSPVLNPNGTIPVSAEMLKYAVARWLRALPPIPAPEYVSSGYATSDIPPKPVGAGQPDEEVVDAEEADDEKDEADEIEGGADLEMVEAAFGRESKSLESLLERDRRERAENPGIITFPKHKIAPLYSFRHTYAQTHADAGTEPHVLQDLMGHDKIETTYVYFRMPMQRKVEAQGRVAALTAVTWHGRRWAVGPGASLSQAETKALLLSQVVPHGYCAEPSVLRVGVHACPGDYQCPTCRHFSTDAGHLPELYEHWSRLIASREYVLGPASPFADERVKILRAELIQAEANAVFDLIEQCQDAIRQLPASDADAIFRAIKDLRRQRREYSRLIPESVRGTVRLNVVDVAPFVRGSDTGYEDVERELKRRATGGVR